MEGLWHAQETFQSEGDGGLEGARLACQAVARYIAVRHEDPLFASPFLHIAGAFSDLIDKGVVPELFSNDPSIRERSRSSRRKHAQLFAASLMEALMDLGESAVDAARIVAQGVARWSLFGDQQVTPTTVRNWRDACRRDTDDRHTQFLRIKEQLRREPNPRAAVEDFLANGPPGVPKS